MKEDVSFVLQWPLTILYLNFSDPSQSGIYEAVVDEE